MALNHPVSFSTMFYIRWDSFFAILFIIHKCSNYLFSLGVSELLCPSVHCLTTCRQSACLWRNKTNWRKKNIVNVSHNPNPITEKSVGEVFLQERAVQCLRPWYKTAPWWSIFIPTLGKWGKKTLLLRIALTILTICDLIRCVWWVWSTGISTVIVQTLSKQQYCLHPASLIWPKSKTFILFSKRTC